MKQIALKFNLGDPVYCNLGNFLPDKGIIVRVEFEHYFLRGTEIDRLTNVDYIELGYPIVNYIVRLEKDQKCRKFYDDSLLDFADFRNNSSINFVRDLYANYEECSKESRKSCELPF